MSSASKSRTRLFRAVCTLVLCAAPCLASLASSSRTSSIAQQRHQRQEEITSARHAHEDQEVFFKKHFSTNELNY